MVCIHPKSTPISRNPLRASYADMILSCGRSAEQIVAVERSRCQEIILHKLVALGLLNFETWGRARIPEPQTWGYAVLVSE